MFGGDGITELIPPAMLHRDASMFTKSVLSVTGMGALANREAAIFATTCFVL